MTKDQFIRLHRVYTAGVIALGVPVGRKMLSGGYSSAEQVGDAMTDLTDTARDLLGKLFDSLLADPPQAAAPTPSKPAATPANGHTSKR